MLIVDVQRCFMNEFTSHIPMRISHFIQRRHPESILFTRFINYPAGPYQRFLKWTACEQEPETDIAPELQEIARDSLIFSKQGTTGLSEELRRYLTGAPIQQIDIVGVDTDMCVLKIAMDIFDLGIEPFVYTDCCASTAGLQAHLAGLSVLTRNIGANRLKDAGLSEGMLAAPQGE